MSLSPVTNTSYSKISTKLSKLQRITYFQFQPWNYAAHQKTITPLNSVSSKYSLHHLSRSHMTSRLSALFCCFGIKREENLIFHKVWRLTSADSIFDEDYKSALTFLLRCLLPKIQSILTIRLRNTSKIRQKIKKKSENCIKALHSYPTFHTPKLVFLEDS